MDACEFDSKGNKSFDIMFANKNEKMLEWLKIIDDKYEQRKESTERAIKDAKERHQTLQKEIKTLELTQECGCYHEEDKKTHSRKKIVCKRCNTVNNKRKVASGMYIKILEKVFPDCKNSRLSIAFEMLMPDHFAMLRFVVLMVKQLTYPNGVQRGGTQREWRELLKARIGDEKKGKVQFCPNNLYSNKVWTSFMYGNLRHCTKKADSFFVDCGCDVQSYTLTSTSDKCSLPKITSYQLKQLDLSEYSEIDITSYKSMQEFISKSDELTQNDVLCKQDICPSDMSLNNFLSFASMKRNSNLILNRILLDITQKKLKWNSQQNVLLILQSLWQGLPHNSSEFVNNSQFCNLLLREIDKYMDSICDNWEQHYTLLCLIFILRRFVDFSHFYYDKGLKLLIKARKISIKWIKTIENKLSETQSNMIDTSDAVEKSIKNLRKLLVLLNIIQCLTFFHFGSELRLTNIKKTSEEKSEDQSEDQSEEMKIGLLAWVICMNNIFENYKCVGGDYFIANLLAISRIDKPDLVRNVMMKYMPKVQDNVLNGFLNHKWRQNNKIYKFRRVPKSSQFIADDNSVALQVDIETGMFLINGTSVSRLPPKILENSDFQDLFPNVILEVNALPKQRYQTKYQFKGYDFIFEYVDKSHRVVIKQFRKNSSDEYVFINKKYIKNLDNILLPSMMISSHWHWLNVQESSIQFRDKKHAFDPLSKESIKYVWYAKLNVVERLGDGYYLINTKKAYRKLIEFFERLEESQHIYMWQKIPHDGLNGNANIERSNYHIYCELPRFNLTFELKSNIELYSKEYDMLVDTNQGLDTLVGLQSKLVLTKNTPQHARKVLIVPYGEVQCQQDESDDNHHKTIINQLNNTEEEQEFETRLCYAFEVDSTLKCLRGQDTIESWCYLALLHARTSYVLCDAFTKMTGVESSMHWIKNQCMPFGTKFSTKAMDILAKIAELSPSRQYVDGEINLPVQQIRYIKNISEHAQFDGYVLLIQKIEAQMEQSQSTRNNEDCELTAMEYMRNSELYSSICINSLIMRDGWKRSINDCSENSSLELKFETTKVAGQNFASDRVCNRVADFANIGLKSKTMAPKKLTLDNFKFCDVDDWDEIDVLQEWCALYQIAQSDDKQSHERLKMLISYKLFENGTKSDEDGNLNIVDERNLLWRLIYICDHWEQFCDINVPNDIIVKCSDDWFKEIYFDDHKIDEFCEKISKSQQPEELKFDENDSKEFIQKATEEYEQEKIKVEQMMGEIREGFSILQTYFNKGELKNIDEFKCKDEVMDNVFKNYISKIKTIYYNKVLLKHFKSVNEHFGLNRIDNVNYTTVETLTIQRKDTMNVARYCLSDHMSIDDKCLVSLGLSVRYHKSMSIDDIQSLLFVQNELSISRRLKPCYKELAIGLFTKRDGNIQHPNNGWKIEDYPAWLAFEIVTGMVIRRKQCQLAMHLLQSETKEQEQIVTQLNMGEGKTSVILPIMALHLSNGIDCLSRIIVLRSLFPTNLSALHSLFGILGRCVLSLPCNRATKLNPYFIYNSLETTLRKKGTIVATSDEIMSFNLRIRESGGSEQKGLQLCQKWLNKYVQNIMDEADEILHPRNQLIYPTGNPFIIDGKHIRWRTCMAVLEAMYAVIDPIYMQYGEKHIQYRETAVGGNASTIATYIRLITEDCYQQLCQQIIKYIIRGKCQSSFVEFIPNWSPEEQKKVMKVIRSKSNIIATETEDNMDDMDDMDDRKERMIKDDKNIDVFNSLSDDCRYLVLTLRGVLYHGCLLSVLKKRFNIDYGLPDNKRRVEKNRTEMAVPYRAKNVPSECSEFSHCDVAILITLLSYYYNGLNEAQMHNLFYSGKIDRYYSSWMKKLKLDNSKFMTEKNLNIFDLPAKWEGVNLYDEKLKSLISKALCNFVPVINFYCDQMVFPHYCKQFEFRLCCSPWDIAERSDNDFITTGFAGTNGLQSIYPISIKQHDLTEEKDLNFRLDDRLCKPYRDTVCLDSRYTGISLENIDDIPRKCNILLDCGGIVECSNSYSFAKCWLESRKPDQQAIIYFDMYKNTLQVLDLSGMIVDYETSSYKNNISKLCLVFLDQFHTRGTDLKLPKKSLACITLGTGLTRDELAQGAMRMRQLEKVLVKDAKEKQDENDDCYDFRFEQEFVYLAPFDVYSEIIPVKKNSPKNKKSNSKKKQQKQQKQQKPQRKTGAVKTKRKNNCNSKSNSKSNSSSKIKYNHESKLKKCLMECELSPIWTTIEKAHRKAGKAFVDFDSLIGISKSGLNDLCDVVGIEFEEKLQFLHLVKEHINEKQYGKCQKPNCICNKVKYSTATSNSIGGTVGINSTTDSIQVDNSVLLWCKNNSKELINRMAPIWANQGLLFYLQVLKRTAHEKDSHFIPDYQEIEMTNLESMYGGSLDKENILTVIDQSNIFHGMYNRHFDDASFVIKQEIQQQKNEFIEAIKFHVRSKFDYKNILVFHNQESCDDEQERHLERETETETQRQLPRGKKAVKPVVSHNLVAIFQSGWTKNGLLLSSDECKCVYENEDEDENESDNDDDNDDDIAQLYSPPKNWLLMFWKDYDDKDDRLNYNRMRSATRHVTPAYKHNCNSSISVVDLSRSTSGDKRNNNHNRGRSGSRGRGRSRSRTKTKSGRSKSTRSKSTRSKSKKSTMNRSKSKKNKSGRNSKNSGDNLKKKGFEKVNNNVFTFDDDDDVKVSNENDKVMNAYMIGDVSTVACGIFVTQHEASMIKKYGDDLLDGERIGSIWSLHCVCSRLTNEQSMLYNEYTICKHSKCGDNQHFGIKFETLLNENIGNLYFKNEYEFEAFCQYNILCLKPYNDFEKKARNSNKILNDGFVIDDKTRKQLWEKDILKEQEQMEWNNESPIEFIKNMISIERNEMFLRESHIQRVINRAEKPNFQSIPKQNKSRSKTKTQQSKSQPNKPQLYSYFTN